MFWQPRKLIGAEGAPSAERIDTIRAGLIRDVRELAGRIGERNVQRRYAKLVEAAEYIESELRAAGYACARQEFPAAGRTVWNVEAEMPGASRRESVVVIGAHYDTVVSCAGANDNASAVASGLALARAFRGLAARRTLRFVFFANEEAPYFMTAECGSIQYAMVCRARGERLAGMICLECMGSYYSEPGTQRYPKPLDRIYPPVGDFVAFVGNLRSYPLTRRLINSFRRHAAVPSAGIAMPALLRDLKRSDHYAFWLQGYQAVMVTDTANFRYRHYHTPEDTPDKLNYGVLAEVVAGLEDAIREY